MRASRSFRSIIILFANASATRSCPGLLNFRMGLGYASVRVCASGGGRPRRTTDTWLFSRFFNTPPFRSAFRRPISNANRAYVIYRA